MNRQLLAVVVSGALALPMAAQVQADEMGVEPHDHMGVYEHGHPATGDAEAVPMHAHEFSVHGHDALHGHEVPGSVAIEASGHINRALVFSGLKGTDDPNHVDGAASGSRFRFSGTTDLQNGITAGVNLEYGAGGTGGANPSIRHANISLSGAFGALTVGQTGPASHIIGYANFDPTAWLSGAEIGCDFCTASGMKSSVFTSFGAGRMEVVKYETPSLGPTKLSFSADGNKFWDAALRAAGDVGAMSYQLNLGYTSYPKGSATPATDVFVDATLPALTQEMVDSMFADHTLRSLQRNADSGEFEDLANLPLAGYEVLNKDGDVVKRHYLDGNGLHRLYTPGSAAAPASEATTVSGALAFGQGTHINLTWGQNDHDGLQADDEFTHFGVGHIFGDTSVALTLTDSDTGGGGQSWAVGIGHVVGGVELYAGHKYLDHDSKFLEDYGFTVVGSRIRFN